MGSDQGDGATRYHDATKHSELSLRMSGHYLDWSSKPSPFKTYKNLPTIALPRNFPLPREDALTAIRINSTCKDQSIDLARLAEILFFSAGLTRKMRISNETHYMRAASATGALYPIELYAVTSGIHGLDPGVYHFNPLGFSLDILRLGNFSSQLASTTGATTFSSPVTLIFTSLAWRNAWKYEARSYRHWFWDAGVMAANLLAVCSAERLTARLVMGFVDANVDHTLGLKNEQEASVALAMIGESPKPSDYQEPSSISQLNLETEPSSREEVNYPIIWQTNQASAIHSQAETELWKNGLKPNLAKSGPSGPLVQLGPMVGNSPPLGDAILRRGSTRRFAQKPISYEALSTIIESSTGNVPLDFLHGDDSLTEFYLIANDVTGLPSGAYHFDRSAGSLEKLKEGKLRYVSGYLCLEQLLFSDASVAFFLMSDLGRALRELGSRGYRAAQFEAGVRAGKIYLSSYAQGIGASGSTFYDDAVTEFFSPHAKDMSTMIAVGVGVPAYKARPGKILPQFRTSPRKRE